ncbi:MAG: Asp23/Gls24 family envelope stress response protein [Dysosmobacter welbionis]
MSKGVSITYHDDNSISIELHIIVENGVNLPAVCRSIMNEVRYVVTGTPASPSRTWTCA